MLFWAAWFSANEVNISLWTASLAIIVLVAMCLLAVALGRPEENIKAALFVVLVMSTWIMWFGLNGGSYRLQ